MDCMTFEREHEFKPESSAWLREALAT